MKNLNANREGVTRIVIVGGVAGGASAAARARRLDEQASILVFERGAEASFANCGLPYYLGGEISDRDQLLVAGDRQLKDWLNLDVRTLSEVTAIDREAQEVEVRELDTGRTYREPYDYLILSTGAAPIRPGPLLEKVGADHPRVCSLRNLADVDRIKAVVDSGAQSAVVIGGGFIGLEVVEQLVHRGVQTSLVELLPQVMPPLDREMVTPLHESLVAHGVDLHLDDGVAALEPAGDGINVRLNSGQELSADFALLAIGVRPESDLAKAAGLELTDRGAIRVDAGQQTSDPRIYAVGDAVEVAEPIFGGSAFVPLGGPANRQGRLVADRIATREGRQAFRGETLVYRGSQGTSIVRVFDVSAGMTGMSEKALGRMSKVRGKDFNVVYAHPNNHAGYYPGATPVSMKLIYEMPSGRVLGAQAVGADGIDKRIDVIAMAIQMKATVFDLEQAELCYAPPFGSAKDPVNIVGFIAANTLRGLTQTAHVDDLPAGGNATSPTIVDVRTAPEFAVGAVPGALHVPLEELRDRLTDVPRDKPVVTYCKSGHRGYIAERILRQHGYNDARNLSGGFLTWKQFHPQPLPASGPAATAASPQAVAEHRADRATSEASSSQHAAEAAETLDARGLQCPGPIMAVAERIGKLSGDSRLKVLASDPGFTKDIAAWCRSQGHTLLSAGPENGSFVALIEPQSGDSAPSDAPATQEEQEIGATRGQTIVVFSGDLDRVLAAFVIANGAAAMGHPVTMFFTFWGLNALRKEKSPSVKKGVLDRMFGWMMPRGVQRLKLSQMNMGGIGTAMMKHVMRKKRVASLPELMDDARRQGVRMVACTMSMDVMGIQPEELIDGLEFGGVGAYIGDAQAARMNLFI